MLARAAAMLLLGSLPAVPAAAAPPAPAPVHSAPAAPAPQAGRALPDYGGRDSGIGAGAPDPEAGQPALNPLAQAGRALEALIVVLVGVAGVLYLLKRYGLVKTGGLALPPLPGTATGRSVGASADAPLLTVLRAQPLPGSPGAALHLVTVADRTLLLGVTPQSVNLLVEWEADAASLAAETPAEKEAFANYLAAAGLAPEVTPAESLAAPLRAATGHLQSLLARHHDSPSREGRIPPP